MLDRSFILAILLFVVVIIGMVCYVVIRNQEVYSETTTPETAVTSQAVSTE